MKEKIGALVRSENLRGFSKKVFNKKTIYQQEKFIEYIDARTCVLI